MYAAACDEALLRKEARGSRVWHAALYAYLSFVFLTGGSSQEHGWTDALAQLMSLPILAVSLWQLSGLSDWRVRTIGLSVLGIILLLPWVQLLSLGKPLWMLADARVGLARDLVTAGVTAPDTTWSLTPNATLRAALSLLPAAALCAAALVTNRDVQRRLLILCVVLPLVSLILAFMQLGAPQDSLLNPYPQWAPAMNGTFANPNHQGTAMLIGIGTCLAFATGAVTSRDENDGVARNPWPAIIVGILLLLCLPLTNSRAAVLIGVLMLATAPVAMAATSLRGSGGGRHLLVALTFASAVASIGLVAAIGWMKVDALEDIRWVMRESTMDLAGSQLPWGSGIGSFVPVFQQALPESLLMQAYINAAHNDLAQVWLEAGLASLVTVTGMLVVIGLALVGHIRKGFGDRRLVWATMLGLAALVAHSVVDYPLRTPALLGIGALLVGILVSQGTSMKRGRGTS